MEEDWRTWWMRKIDNLWGISNIIPRGKNLQDMVP